MAPRRGGDVEAAQDAAMQALHRASIAEAEVERLRSALDVLSEGVVVCDAEGQVVYRNAPAQRLEGARHTDALAARALEELLELARRGAPASRTLELHGPPARTLAIDVRSVPGGTVAVIQDMTARRQLDAVRRDFVANVSHELRTPVGALGVLAETLAEERDLDVVHRLADRVSAEVERASSMIEDLLDLSRIEAESHQPQDLVPVARILKAARDHVSPLAEQAGVGVDVSEDEDLEVCGHERQLVSAMANLLDNAIKYSEPGAVVRVSTRLEEGWIDLIVEDDGIGIPSKDMERIFERFYRVDRARSRETGGTGLGLAIVRHVATNHGGHVTVRSIEGEGSTFTLRLPAPS